MNGLTVTEHAESCDMQGIYEMLTECRRQDGKVGGGRAKKFLQALPDDCRTLLQMYVLNEHGEQAQKELYELLNALPGHRSEVAEWVDTQLGS